MRFSTEVTVQANAARTFSLQVPLSPAPPHSYGTPLIMNLSGPGTDEGSTVMFPTLPRRGKPLTALIGMSEGLAARFGSQVGSEIGHQNRELAMTKFSPAEFPEDWRTLVGIEALWLTATEISDLSPPRRGALRNWVQRGGTLVIVGAAEVPVDLRETAFGEVRTMPSAELNVAHTATSILAADQSLPLHLVNTYRRDFAEFSRARFIVGEVEINLPLLIGFMTVFAVVAGPVNLYLLAPGGRRHRLFWTTPLISVGASLMLYLIIVLQDGFGGSGLRTALVCLLPGERKQVVLQEQLTRTGVLRSAEFEIAEPAFIAPIDLERGGYSRNRRLRANDRKFGGDWFESRSLQAHWLEAIPSTRGEIALLNAAETRGTEVAPVVLSSISAPLEELYYLDEQRRVWRGKNVRPGEKSTLERTSEFPELLPEQAGPRLKAAWKVVAELPGHFYGTASSSDALINTLPSIRWHHERVVYTGRVSTVATPNE